MVCPPQLCKDVFTSGAIDNIDHNPSSTTAKDSFHGTGISLFQHTSSSIGVPRDVVRICSKPGEKKTKIEPLPDEYSNVTPLALKENEPNVDGGAITKKEMLPNFVDRQTE